MVFFGCFFFFFLNPSFKLAMSGRAGGRAGRRLVSGVGCRPRFTLRLTFFKVVCYLYSSADQRTAFIFGRDEEEDQ